ncbi:vWA domain-containing protein [Dyadobacter frigoris]|uniref:VWA domain-containing protein n=1 Tax=Dyadobacter frigoris TaxID=2576211 RepID=A0A4U6CSQ1_9BACT|nr:VWA domain-containing protein [Dyadobacter frigoris]TKT85958.1 VWA domain-containing protein [Dyadobacter frigoris]GLU57163.1 VWA domain-containing protein [Dyadobacter frigoris]
MNWNYPFESTEYFFIFFFILAYITFFYRTIRVARQLNTTARTLILKLFLRTIYFALLIVSLLGPSFGEADQAIQSKGKDIYILIDLSKSMDATDVTPTRLEKVKFEINHFVQNQHSNRIGLIVFSNEAFVQVPLTYDAAALELFIQSLQTELLPTSGTNICGATELAYKKLVDGNDRPGRSKMIVIFTDGENKSDCYRSLYNNIRRFGVGVYVAAVGTKNGSSIPSEGKPLKDEKDNLVISKLDDDFLQTMAISTKGSYYELNNEKNEINRMISEINNADGTLVDTRTVTVVSNKYYYFLGAALFLLILDILITIGTFRL